MIQSLAIGVTLGDGVAVFPTTRARREMAAPVNIGRECDERCVEAGGDA